MEIAQFVDDGKRTPGFRCGRCGRLLAEGEKYRVEIRCDRCGALNHVLEHFSEQVIITDKQGTILYVNEEVEKITGYLISEVIGKKPSLWGGQMPKEFYEQMWKTLIEKKQGVAVKVKNRSKAGKNYEALLRISPVLDTSGEIKFFVGFEKILS